MQIPVQIAFRGMDSSPALEARINEKTEKLEQYHDRITSCRVVVEAPHRHSRKGKLYVITIDVTVPGAELVVNTEKRHHRSHEDVYVALRDAFNAMTRQLEDHARETRGQVKTHESQPRGIVVRLFENHGFIETPDRGEIYFHRNSVVDDKFDDLEEGGQVRFSATQGEKGLQATTVHAAA
ncbi:MAG: ribosome-associated translation inhibitor RaiA [Alphaproteobacteria bacterium]|nr:ribosome-associated translation inhibitor RaiA [Alphaproteobacteria bacterium]